MKFINVLQLIKEQKQKEKRKQVADLSHIKSKSYV